MSKLIWSRTPGSWNDCLRINPNLLSNNKLVAPFSYIRWNITKKKERTRKNNVPAIYKKKRKITYFKSPSRTALSWVIMAAYFTWEFFWNFELRSRTLAQPEGSAEMYDPKQDYLCLIRCVSHLVVLDVNKGSWIRFICSWASAVVITFFAWILAMV